MMKSFQLGVLHISDMHFGENHRFTPEATAMGDIPSEKNFPTLAKLLIADLPQDDPGFPVIMTVTGDLTESAGDDEFVEARTCIQEIVDSGAFGGQLERDKVFLVPGNHDAQYKYSKEAQRWRRWAHLNNQFYKEYFPDDDPRIFEKVHDRRKDLGAIIVTLNSALNVTKGQHDENRGRLEEDQLDSIRKDLGSIGAEKKEEAIRIALLHHHPVLIPPLTEPGRGFDAVHRADELLIMLRDHGFHVILHGHKHDPYYFTDDTISGFVPLSEHSMVILAGGSIGSRTLPDTPNKRNTYGYTVIKWNPTSNHYRVDVDIRGLETHTNKGAKLPPNEWRFSSIKKLDRSYLAHSIAPKPGQATSRSFEMEQDVHFEEHRDNLIRDSRGNYLVCYCEPSINPNCAFHVRIWIQTSGFQTDDKFEIETPEEVTWYAGQELPVITISKENDPSFCIDYDYDDPILIQAHLHFRDGHEVHLSQVISAPSK